MVIASPFPSDRRLARIVRWLRDITGRERRRHIVHTGCDLVLAAARQEYFYTVGGVPDSFSGRFEMTVIHAVLVFRRLKVIGVAGVDLAQAMFDRLFRSFDDALRHQGVGDMSVGKKIRKMGEAFYGRAAAYDQALRTEAPIHPLSEALRRNLSLPDDRALELAEYMLRSCEELDRTSDADMLAARFAWATK